MNGPMSAICRRIASRRVTNRFEIGFALLIIGLYYYVPIIDNRAVTLERTGMHKVRTPVWIAVGREVRRGKGQPLMFNKPKVLAANDFAPYGGGHEGDAEGNTEIGTSPSLFEYEGRVYFFGSSAESVGAESM
jgi:hypothetical protein